jgi:hypothetical protein
VTVVISMCRYIYLPSQSITHANNYLFTSQTFINPMYDRFTKWEVFWSEWVESCRKDVECFFGLVKSQWRWLRNKVEYHDVLIIQHAMYSACILHNMLLEYKEYDTFKWDLVDPEGEEEMHDEFEAHAEEELIVRVYLLYFIHIHPITSIAYTNPQRRASSYNEGKSDATRRALTVLFLLKSMVILSAI